MSQQDYLDSCSDFMFQIQSCIGYDTNASRDLLPKLQHALRTIEILYVPHEHHRQRNVTEVFERQMDEIEATITEKLYQHGNPRELFIEYDVEQCGFLTPSSFARMCESLEMYLSDEELQFLVQKYDTAHRGCINYTDFLSIGQQQGMRSESQTAYSSALFRRPAAGPEEPDPHDQDDFVTGSSIRAKELVAMIRTKLYQKYKHLTDLFLHLDVGSGNSLLSVEELQDGLARTGIVVSISELCEMVAGFVKEDGMLSVQDFAHFLESPSSAYSFLPTTGFNNGMDTRIETEEDPVDHQDLLPEVDYDDESLENDSGQEKPLEQISANLAQLLRSTGKSMRHIFQCLHSEGNQSGIDRIHLRKGLSKLGIPITVKDCDRILAYYDDSGNGQLEYHEFVKMMQSLYLEDEDRRHRSSSTD